MNEWNQYINKVLKSKDESILGPSGSGKTSLLSAILKEMIQTSGQRDLDSAEKFSKYSVLPQNPWLLNATGRRDIFEEIPYSFIVI